MVQPARQWSLMSSLMRFLPQHEHFVSVFGGLGAEFLCKKPSKLETFNDLDQNIYNLFTVLMNNRRGLVQRLKTRPAATGNRRKADRLASVVTYLTNVRLGLRAAGIRNETPADVLEFVRHRFLPVQIECDGWYQIVKKLDGQNTLFFVDPPELAEGQQAALFALLNGLGGQVILLGKHGPSSSNGLGKWQRKNVRGTTVWLKLHDDHTKKKGTHK